MARHRHKRSGWTEANRIEPPGRGAAGSVSPQIAGESPSEADSLMKGRVPPFYPPLPPWVHRESIPRRHPPPSTPTANEVQGATPISRQPEPSAKPCQLATRTMRLAFGQG